jgi:glyoxylase-like metal-dependent hydrolase (beta-lactamase superfamily II)
MVRRYTCANPPRDGFVLRRNLSDPRSAQMIWPVRPVPDFDRISPYLCIWHTYDSSVKAELYSTGLTTAEGRYLIDPILLEKGALEELISAGGVAGIIVTNSNHHRAFAHFARQFSIPIFAHRDTFPDKMPSQLRRVADGDEICDGLRVIGINGAVSGEIVLHYAPDGGTLIVGDALINFEPYGFTFLPRKYCSNEKEMRRSLRKLLDFKIERILFAHGTPILSGASDRLRGLLGSPKD